MDVLRIIAEVVTGPGGVKIDDIKAEGEEDDDDDDEETPVDFASDPVEFIRTQVFKFIDLAKIDPVLAFKTYPETGAGLALSVVTLFGMLGVLLGFAGSQPAPITKVRLCAASIIPVLE